MMAIFRGVTGVTIPKTPGDARGLLRRRRGGSHSQQVLRERPLEDINHRRLAGVAEDGVEIVEEDLPGRVVTRHAQGLNEIDVGQRLAQARAFDHVLLGGLAAAPQRVVEELRFGSSAHPVVDAPRLQLQAVGVVMAAVEDEAGRRRFDRRRTISMKGDRPLLPVDSATLGEDVQEQVRPLNRPGSASSESAAW
jgi:hypothetical protein